MENLFCNAMKKNKLNIEELAQILNISSSSVYDKVKEDPQRLLTSLTFEVLQKIFPLIDVSLQEEVINALGMQESFDIDITDALSDYCKRLKPAMDNLKEEINSIADLSYSNDNVPDEFTAVIETVRNYLLSRIKYPVMYVIGEPEAGKKSFIKALLNAPDFNNEVMEKVNEALDEGETYTLRSDPLAELSGLPLYLKERTASYISTAEFTKIFKVVFVPYEAINDIEVDYDAMICVVIPSVGDVECETISYLERFIALHNPEKICLINSRADISTKINPSLAGRSSLYLEAVNHIFFSPYPYKEREDNLNKFKKFVDNFYLSYKDDVVHEIKLAYLLIDKAINSGDNNNKLLSKTLKMCFNFENIALDFAYTEEEIEKILIETKLIRSDLSILFNRLITEFKRELYRQAIEEISENSWADSELQALIHIVNINYCDLSLDELPSMKGSGYRQRFFRRYRMICQKNVNLFFCQFVNLAYFGIKGLEREDCRDHETLDSCISNINEDYQIVVRKFLAKLSNLLKKYTKKYNITLN